MNHQGRINANRNAAARCDVFRASHIALQRIDDKL